MSRDSSIDAPGAAPARPDETPRVVWRRPLPHMAGEPVNRFLCRAVTALFRRRIVEVHGIERMAPVHDPFVMVLNHNMKLEAVVLPTIFIGWRGGKRVHFMADWNSQLIPGVGSLMRRGQVVTVVRKPARPKFLNVLRPLYAHPTSAFTRARARLEAGAPVGVFVEGTINRDPRRLLPGHPGAARLSLEAEVPLLPVGIRFPHHRGDGPIRSSSRMALRVGEPMVPPALTRPGRRAPRSDVESWHAAMMEELSRLSGKRVARPR